MAPPKKDWKQCPFCKRNEKTEKNEDGFSVVVVGDKALWQLRCPCGIMTKLCMTKRDLQVVWNSRNGKAYEPPQISVTHPPVRGTEPGTVNAQGGFAPF